jgi:mercuric ion binding protein
MKTLKLTLVIALFSLTIWSCKNETEPQVKTVEVEETNAKNEIADDAVLAKAEFNIEGMTCAIGCAKTIEKKLAKMDGVKSAKVDFDKKLAQVEYDDAKVTTTSLESTVTKASDTYSVNDMKTVESFSTDGAKKEKKCTEAEKAACKGKKTPYKEDCKEACCAEKA